MTKRQERKQQYLGLGYEEAEEYKKYCVRRKFDGHQGELGPREYFQAKADYLNALQGDLTDPEVQLKILWLERQLAR